MSNSGITRLLTALFTVMLLLMAYAQTESKDSVYYRESTPDSVRSEVSAYAEHSTDLKHLSLFYPEPVLFPPHRPASISDLNLPHLRFIPNEANLLKWTDGEISAIGYMRVYPGLMQIDSGTVGICQSFGNLTLSAGAEANKYGFFNGLITKYGLTGNVAYRFSPRLSFTAFGTYYFGNPRMFLPPSIAGYYGRTSFGGYLDYQINDYWGVEAGARTVRQLDTNRFESEPIVTPYYKINKKVKIELPIAEILYHILKK